ncbi:hypothetical protein SUT38_11480, partial [Streptococcus agalactiae]
KNYSGRFQPIPDYDLGKELSKVGIEPSDDELEIIPEMQRINYFAEDFIEEYRVFIESKGAGYVKIQEKMNGFTGIYDEMTRYYVTNQHNPRAFGHFQDYVRQYAEMLYRKYKQEKGQALFSRRSFM